MKFRTSFAAVAAVALLGTLAACGGDDDDAATTDTSTQTQPETSTGTTPAPSGDEALHGSEGHSAAGATVTMKGNQFSPATLTVKAGETISIVNADAARHNLTDKKTIDSGDIDGNKTGSVKAPEKAGEYPYKCTYHFGMEGVLKVT